VKWIGDNLKNLRHLHCLSRSQLADKIGLSEQKVWSFENNYAKPDFNEMNKIKSFFHVKPRYFSQPDLLSKADKENIDVSAISFRFFQQ